MTTEIDLTSGEIPELSREDVHTPVNFMPENYEFVGAYHNAYTFGSLAQYSNLNNRVAALRALLDGNWRPHGPGDGQCDHCGQHIAFVGVFKHIVTGDHIAVGSQCADNRFPLSNAAFQALRKAHRLSRAHDLAVVKFAEWQTTHPEIDWVAAHASTDPRVRRILADGVRYGSLFDYKLSQLQAALQPAPVAPVAAPAPAAPQTPEMAWITAYNGSSSFFKSLQDQARRNGRLSPKQLDCITRELKKQASANDPVAQAQRAVNQKLVPGVYIAADGSIWKVQGNMAYKSGAKRAVARKEAFDPSTVGGARLYAKVWSTSTGSRPTLSELTDGVDMTHTQGWEYVRGGIDNLVVDHQMNSNEVKDFAAIYGQCVWCGKALENTQSYGTKFLEKGIGPVCIKYIDATVKPDEIVHVGHNHN